MISPGDVAAAGSLLPPSLAGPLPPAAVRELAGDASTRRYLRVVLGPGAAVPTVVLMLYPDDVAPGAELPFVNVHRYLARANVPVPAIYHALPAEKVLVLEDAGDTTLETAAHAPPSPLAGETAEERSGLRRDESVARLYERCIEILVRIQTDATDRLDGAAIPRGLAFDVRKFAEEIDFFFAHAVREYGGIALSEREERAIEDRFLPFLSELAALPRVLSHRDYHSRNVMVTDSAAGPGLRILDFQDARMGNVYYDLASLLRDSYVTFPEKFEERLRYAWLHAAPASLRRTGGGVDGFERRLDLAALQRNVKAIGTFGNQAANRGKTFYLRFIPPTVAHLRANFERNPEMRALRALLWPILEALAEKAAREAPP